MNVHPVGNGNIASGSLPAPVPVLAPVPVANVKNFDKKLMPK